MPVNKRVFYSLEQARWRRAGQELRRKLSRFAELPVFSWDAARAQDLYLEYIDKKLLDSADDIIMERCFEWFIFDYKLYSGKTIIESYRDRHRQSLSKHEVTLLQKWAVSCNSMYELIEVLPEEGLIIKDIFSSVQIKVSDANAPLDIEQGSILLIRVLPVGEEYEFSTNGLVLPASLKEPLRKKLQQDRLEFYGKQKNRAPGWSDYLKERAPVINAWVMDLGLPNPESGGEKMERIAILTIIDWEEVLNFIKCSARFRLIGQTYDAAGAFRQATAAILGEGCGSKVQGEDETGSGGEGKAPDSGRTTLRPVIGRLLLTTRFMIVTAVTAELLADSKDLLLKLFNKIIVNGLEQWQQRRGGNPASVESELYAWPKLCYAVVAAGVREGLQALGYSLKQQKGAIKLWYDYCAKERPTIRNTAVWSATVIYAFAWLEKEGRLRQQDLARSYGVSPSTISSRFGRLRKSLDLAVRDQRYASKPDKT